ncbi:hypothetical protein FJV41_33135 [Myxococcus llanfairpwllgwyngyllgogerychwyrndrobwllllantysiliogogogochensis]|uniref:Uncharacterized protein n=1 Tax=Myxococcus llanfairpwllgwyngyllgogerychwyrndrobwllllantysiliogogogochensis TaxID=2590453 RepID=A0A540WRL0_9BACT|nr:hypothetical protein [Myxococcus llanfairpwllgwyngyllgogerychwyrndrobwllllantysiliogogogochensis]TQF11640.1 hypothetical protein FJV41_33135 [Myxococcus llanfairpwllgwyngyllgogerychwyrndrobwllllantysiliogogogochensis]
MAEVWDPSKLDAKIEENPTLWSSLDEEWRELVARAVLSDKGMRKLNRISGRLKRGAVGQFQNATATAASLDQTILGCYSLLKYWCAERKPNEQQFYLNNQISTALSAVCPGTEITRRLAERLDAQWKERNMRSKVVVIAHRGDGATFEKVRKVYERQVFDSLFTYTHEHENSEGAVIKALEAWRKKKLSGVECDVWFSQDAVPIVTHTQHIEALFNQENNRGLVPPLTGAKVKDVPSGNLPPRFLTLDRWLQIIEAYLQEHSMDLDGNRQVRLEIEMKDTNLAFGPNTVQNEKEQVLARWRSVERIVSRFLKSCNRPSIYQIALFNGSAAPKGAYDKSSNEHKTLLSSVVYGGSPDSPGTSELQEVRYGLHSSGLLELMYSGQFAGKILTLAPGVEAVPLDQPVQLDTLGEWIENKQSLTVEQAIQCARLRKILWMFDEMTAGRLPRERKPLRIQVLTDFCEIGAKFIVKNKATPIGPRGLFDQAFDEQILRCVWRKYNLEGAPQETKRQVCQALNSCGNDQNKLIEFGMEFLRSTGDWYQA